MKNVCFCRILCGMMILLIPLLAACAPTAPETLSVTAMDTVMSLSVYGGGADTCARIRERTQALDRCLSAVDENSEIYALNHSSAAALSDDALALIQRSLTLCWELDGSFDITVYPAVSAWGFTSGDYRVPEPQELQEIARHIDYHAVTIDGNTVTLPEGFMLDPGAVAKGYLADECRAILDDAGARAAVLNLGGTICLYGSKPDGSSFKVGVADPVNPAAYFGTLRLGECVVATSGGYERYFELDGRRYIHIINPMTAAPVDNGVMSVTIVADEGVTADAYSTALFVMGAEDAAAFYRSHGGFEYILLTDDGTLYVSEGLADRFTLGDGYDYTIQIISS